MLNQICLQGRLVKDPELLVTQSGKDICRFRLAVERNIKNAEGKRDVDYFSCIVWGGQAKMVKDHFKRGQMMICAGSMWMSKYEKDGKTMTVYEVNVSNINFANKEVDPNSAPKAEPKKAPVQAPAYDDYNIISDEEDLPF